VLSKIILNVRFNCNYTGGIENASLVKTGDKKITNNDFRDAVNRTAIYWSTTSWDPANTPYINDPEMLLLTANAPMLPLVSGIQNGWGVVDESIVNETVGILLGKKEWTPSLEKQLAEPYMNAIYELRKIIWENWPLDDSDYNRIVEEWKQRQTPAILDRWGHILEKQIDYN